jgi:hypothetical protein
MRTGWREEDILALPVERFNSYIRTLNEINSEDE